MTQSKQTEPIVKYGQIKEVCSDSSGLCWSYPYNNERSRIIFAAIVDTSTQVPDSLCVSWRELNSFLQKLKTYWSNPKAFDIRGKLKSPREGALTDYGWKSIYPEFKRHQALLDKVLVEGTTFAVNETLGALWFTDRRMQRTASHNKEIPREDMRWVRETYHVKDEEYSSDLLSYFEYKLLLSWKAFRGAHVKNITPLDYDKAFYLR